MPTALHMPVPCSELSSSLVTTSASRRSESRSSETKSPAVKLLTKSQLSPSVTLKAQPVACTIPHEQLHRYFPSRLESPLAVLASKGLFPNFLGSPESLLAQTSHSAGVVHPSLSLAISEHQLAIQNAISFAQSRAVMEHITSHPHIPAGPFGQLPQSLSLHLQPGQQNQLRPSTGHQQLSIPDIRHPVPHSERPVSLQAALAHTHSRALLERINNNPIISPVISLENTAAHSYGRKIFPCPQCRYTTDRRNNLKRHMLTMHQTSSKMLECCGILFNTKASLREHAMIFHYHGYTCYFCGRRFCRKALLKRHLSVHNGQKDFVCNVCDYATSHKSNLERHRKVHSRQDDGRDGDDGPRYHDDEHQYHDEVKSNGSEAISHDDVSSDDLSVCSDYDDDIDVEINVHSD
ncbi:unnamed protein product [Candidula unifasciata]|uniref:C2H2-type domain-containing protein n=1 Tax=Candidula unifasciata TaxID=100452 RepID=A0A8S3ZNL6_9EUPU|nr:unnamed protein product [Candidula unifasciata]